MPYGTLAHVSMAYWNTPTNHRKAIQRKERRKLAESDEDARSDDATRDDDIDDEVRTPKARRKAPSKKAKAAPRELTEDEEEGSDEEKSQLASRMLEHCVTDTTQN